jgi:hypothetical protein
VLSQLRSACCVLGAGADFASTISTPLNQTKKLPSHLTKSRLHHLISFCFRTKHTHVEFTTFMFNITMPQHHESS